MTREWLERVVRKWLERVVREWLESGERVAERVDREW